MTLKQPTRRRFIAFLGLAPLLAACSGGGTATSTAQPSSAVATTPANATAAPTGTAGATAIASPATASVTASPTVGRTPVSAAPSSTGPTAAISGTPTVQPGASPTAKQPATTFEVREYAVRGSAPHDVAPALDGGVWYVTQGSGELGLLDPASGEIRDLISIGRNSAPHGVIVGPDGAPWITDGGQNAIVRVDPQGSGSGRVTVFPLPPGTPSTNLNTATFDKQGRLWFTGQNGYYGRLEPSGAIRVFDAPRGRGPYGITTTPDGAVYYASLAGSHIARIEVNSGQAMVIEPPTRDQGARRVWSDSRGRIWVSEWNAGQVGVYDPATNVWREWKLPGTAPQAYAVYVDERDAVWLTDFPNNAIVRFDPATETFQSFPLPSAQANVRQLLGRPGEVWGAESRVNKVVVVRAK